MSIVDNYDHKSDCPSYHDLSMHKCRCWQKPVKELEDELSLYKSVLLKLGWTPEEAKHYGLIISLIDNPQ